MKPRTNELQDIIRRVQLQDIRLIEIEAKSAIRSAQEMPEVEVRLSSKARVSERRPNGSFWVRTDLMASIVGSKQKDTPAVSIRLAFELAYILPVDPRPSDAALTKFAEVNGIFNAWPYWREALQNTLHRMELPGIVLPVFRLADLQARQRGGKTARAKVAARGKHRK